MSESRLVSELRRFFLMLFGVAVVLAIPALAQDDTPSLGDVARKARVEKQQKDAPPNSAPASAAQSNSVQPGSVQPNAVKPAQATTANVAATNTTKNSS